MKKEYFTCAWCKLVFEKDKTTGEAIAEAKERYGKDEKDFTFVCGDCRNSIDFLNAMSDIG